MRTENKFFLFGANCFAVRLANAAVVHGRRKTLNYHSGDIPSALVLRWQPGVLMFSPLLAFVNRKASFMGKICTMNGNATRKLVTKKLASLTCWHLFTVCCFSCCLLDSLSHSNILGQFGSLVYNEVVHSVSRQALAITVKIEENTVGTTADHLESFLSRQAFVTVERTTWEHSQAAIESILKMAVHMII